MPLLPKLCIWVAFICFLVLVFIADRAVDRALEAQQQAAVVEEPQLFTDAEAAWLSKARDAMALCKASAPPGATCFWAVHRYVPKPDGVQL